MRKKFLYSAIAATLLNSVSAEADIAITNMFVDDNYMASGTLMENGGGQVDSVDPFFYHTWTLFQQTAFMDNTGSWSGTSAQGSFNYDDSIASMTSNQIAVGSYWSWNGAEEIAHLDIFDCITGVCTGVGVGHQNGPAVGTVLIFSGTDTSFVPVPSAVWLMGSGLLGLVGLARRKRVFQQKC